MSLFYVTILVGIVTSQVNNCIYKVGPAELDLREYKGFTFRYEGNDGLYFYAPCTNDLVCERDGITRSAMMDYYPEGINECIGIANFDSITQPAYDPFVATFFFNYTSNELCSYTNSPLTNRSALFAWTCNEDINFPTIVDVNHYNPCEDYVEIQYVGACVPPPPPNEECIFRDAGHVLNLTTIQGKNLRFTLNNSNELVYSPCANNFRCDTAFGPANNMAEVIDDGGQCIKYLGIWSGDSQVYYDRTVFGQNYYEFFWINGQQCFEGGPNEVLNVRYYCANTSDTVIRSFGPAGPPCQFRIEIDSPLAC